MIEAGVLDGVECVIGAHLWAPIEAGKIGIVYGPMMASPDTFWITVKGKGGHIGMPHQTVDSIAIASQIVTNLQHITSRNMDPLENAVVSVTEFVGGVRKNVIPGLVRLTGQARTFNPEIRKSIPGLIERIVKGVTDAHAASYEFNYEFGYDAVINHDEVTKLVEKTAIDLFGEEAVERVKPVMAGEDFSAYLNRVPGTYFFIGAGNLAKDVSYPHHHPRFNVDEDALEMGMKLFTETVLTLTESKIEWRYFFEK